jgi:hypothetical protein
VVGPTSLLLLLVLYLHWSNPPCRLISGPCNPPGLPVFLTCTSGFYLFIPVPARGLGSALRADMREIWGHSLP